MHYVILQNYNASSQESYYHGSSEVQLLKQKYRVENVTDNLLSTLLPFLQHKWYTWVTRVANPIPQVQFHKQTKHDNNQHYFRVCYLPATYTYLCPHVMTCTFRRLHTHTLLLAVCGLSPCREFCGSKIPISCCVVFSHVDTMIFICVSLSRY